MKKIALTAVAVILALAMAGCSFTSTVTKTETVTDANGNTTTRTSTTTNDNGNVTTSETVEVTPATEAAEAAEATEAQSEKIVATIAFENNSGVLIYGLFFSSALSDTWGDNILEGGGDPLADGYTATCGDALTYSADNLIWDLRIADSDGNTADFKGLDMSKAADPHNITIVMSYDAEENAYYARVE